MDEKTVTYGDFIEIKSAIVKPTELDTSFFEELGGKAEKFADEFSNSVLNQVAMDVCLKCRKRKRKGYLGLPWCICRKAKKRINYVLDRLIVETIDETD